MNLLILCAGDRSDLNISLNILKFLIKKKDKITVCVVDNNKEILSFLKKKKSKVYKKL